MSSRSVLVASSSARTLGSMSANRSARLDKQTIGTDGTHDNENASANPGDASASWLQVSVGNEESSTFSFSSKTSASTHMSNLREEQGKQEEEEPDTHSHLDDRRSVDQSSLSANHDGSSAGLNSDNARKNINDEPVLAQQETKQVGWLRIIVVFSLLVATTILSIITFRSIRQNEEDEFELRFNEHSATIIESYITHVTTALSAVDNFAVSIMADVSVSDNDWPMVYVSDFHRRAATTRLLGSFTSFYISALVEDSERTAYENFTSSHREWFAQGEAFEIETNQSDWKFGNFKPGPADGEDLDTPRDETSGRVESSSRDARRIDEDFMFSNIWGFDGNDIVRKPSDAEPFLPVWHVSPVDTFVNYDLLTDSTALELLVPIETQRTYISKATFIPKIIGTETGQRQPDVPSSFIIHPLLKRTHVTNEDGDVVESVRTVGTINANFFWDAYMQVKQLPKEANDILVILQNTCGQSYTFRVIEGDILFVDPGDLHDRDFNDMESGFSLTNLLVENKIGFGDVKLNTEACPFHINIYPTKKMRRRYLTSAPYVYTGVVLMVFLMTYLVFAGYNCFVERRQQVVMRTALKTHAIVSSLFPKRVRDQMIDDSTVVSQGKSGGQASGPVRTSFTQPGGNRIQRFLMSRTDHTRTDVTAAAEEACEKTQPIAELFPNTTVMFADIVGFTAWSSSRQPSQVFTLLEALYGSFDTLADRRSVFKVETIGDCYLAVAGLPDPQPEHAVIMAKFATDVMFKLAEITQQLEVKLGPDTNELSMRFGLHSGPVTAGVLRGQKSRFQLFGDTVNTASRMESTGKPRRIQCSQQTADQLISNGKSHWLMPREDMIHAKGKGTIQTYWVKCKGKGRSTEPALRNFGSCRSFDTFASSPLTDPLVQETQSLLSPRFQRLIDWNNDLMSTLLKRIVSKNAIQRQMNLPSVLSSATLDHASFHNDESYFQVCSADTNDKAGARDGSRQHGKGSAESAYSRRNDDSIQLQPNLANQLKDLIMTIAFAHRQENCFHNFAHASHVAMSTNKIIERLHSILEADAGSHCTDRCRRVQEIVTDPLSHFACMFAALIHDVDHPGVSNSQLVRENHELAITFGTRGAMQQNALKFGWGLLMESRYDDLRKCLLGDDNNTTRSSFRQLLVSLVMAMDTDDEGSLASQQERWEKAFPISTTPVTRVSFTGKIPKRSSRNIRAEIVEKGSLVLESVLQAGKVSHATQHWLVYQKWNHRLLEEQRVAFEGGRRDTDPYVDWYGHELKFLDEVVIPLTKRLRDCDELVGAGEELLEYAKMNREEWSRRGAAVVKEWREKANQDQQ